MSRNTIVAISVAILRGIRCVAGNSTLGPCPDRVRITLIGAACLLVATRPVHAVPLTFVIDPAASTSLPVTGELRGDFDVFDRTLTFTSGTIHAPPAAGVTTTTPSVIYDDLAPVVGSAVVTASGTGVFSLPALSLQITGGAVTDGGTTAGISATGSGGVGSAAGELVLDIDTFLLNLTESVDYSATGPVMLSLGSGLVQLANNGPGALLSLPVGLAASVTDVELDTDGFLGSFLWLEPFIEGFIEDAIGGQLSSLGRVVATSSTPLPALPDAVTYGVDPARSSASAGALSTALNGTVAARRFDGTLDFAGGSNIFATLDAGVTMAPLVGSVLGVDYDLTVDAVSLDLAFDILSGRVTDGSPVSALDQVLAAGALAITGNASFDGLLGTTHSPFTLMSDLAFDLDLLDPAATIGLTSNAGIETLTIPIAYSLASYTRSNTRIDYDDGLFEGLASILSSLLTTQIVDQVTAGLPLPELRGTLVATSGIRGSDPVPVPEPPTWLLLATAVALLVLRRPRCRVARRRGTTHTRTLKRFVAMLAGLAFSCTASAIPIGTLRLEGTVAGQKNLWGRLCMRAIQLIAATSFLFGPFAANAILIVNGDGTVTDTATNLMWLRDANYAATELNDAHRDAIIAAGNAAPLYDDVYTLTEIDFERRGSAYSGELTWWAAMAWADQLTFAGYDDWRLPTSLHRDPTCTDGVLPGLGFNCTGSELGYLHYISLGNTAGGQAFNGPFTNVPGFQIWSGTEWDPTLSDCGAFNFVWSTGLQDACYKFQYEGSWAVRTIHTVPEPGTLALLASVIFFAGLRPQRQRSCRGKER